MKKVEAEFSTKGLLFRLQGKYLIVHIAAMRENVAPNVTVWLQEKLPVLNHFVP